MTLDKQWFTEKRYGSAYSLKVSQKLHSEQTPYQHIEIYETETFGNLMTIDDYVMLTSRDNFFYHEMMAHPILFTHPNPQTIVIIGGGDCGTLKEVLKHPEVKTVYQVEIDEQVTRLSEQYFPELCTSNEDARAQLLFEDGIQWMVNAKDKSIDVIIVDSSEPDGPGEGLFQAPFYQQCLRALKDDGLLIHQSESPLTDLEMSLAMRQAMHDGGLQQQQMLFFPSPSYPSGWWSAIMAGSTLDIKNYRQQAVKNREFETVYYNQAIHEAAFAMPEFMCR